MKNNQTSVSDADREIPTRGSTDNAGNPVPETRYTSFPALSVDPRVGISRSASETDVRFYLSITFTILHSSRYASFFQ